MYKKRVPIEHHPTHSRDGYKDIKTKSPSHWSTIPIVGNNMSLRVGMERYDLNGSSFIHTPREHWLMGENSQTDRNIVVNKLGSDERRIPPPQMIGTCISTFPRRRKSAQVIFGFHLSWLWFWDTHGHSWKIPECLTIASSPNVWIRSNKSYCFSQALHPVDSDYWKLGVSPNVLLLFCQAHGGFLELLANQWTEIFERELDAWILILVVVVLVYRIYLTIWILQLIVPHYFLHWKEKKLKFPTVMGSLYLTLLIPKISPAIGPLLGTTFLFPKVGISWEPLQANGGNVTRHIFSSLLKLGFCHSRDGKRVKKASNLSRRKHTYFPYLSSFFLYIYIYSLLFIAHVFCTYYMPAKWCNCADECRALA